MGARTATGGVTSSSWGADNGPRRGEKACPEAHRSSKVASIFSLSLGDSTRYRLWLGSTGVTSMGNANRAAETTGAAAEKVTVQTEEDGESWSPHWNPQTTAADSGEPASRAKSLKKKTA